MVASHTSPPIAPHAQRRYFSMGRFNEFCCSNCQKGSPSHTNSCDGSLEHIQRFNRGPQSATPCWQLHRDDISWSSANDPPTGQQCAVTVQQKPSTSSRSPLPLPSCPTASSSYPSTFPSSAVGLYPWDSNFMGWVRPRLIF